MNNIVTWENHKLAIIEYENQKWFSSVDIARALNFAKENAVTKIYNNHKSEFEGGLSCLPKSGKQRLFNREGAWLIGMFARTPKAAEFRKWVLKILGAVANNQLSTAQVDMKAIGGVVKKCAAVAVREEVKQVVAETIRKEVRDMALDVVLSAERFKPLHEVSDETMMNCLYGWYSTRHHKLLDVVKELDEENGRLKSQMAMIKKVVA